MRSILLLWLSLAVALGQPVGPLAAPIEWRPAVAAKNFPLLTLLQQTPSLGAAMEAEPPLAALAASKRAALSRECTAPLPACYAGALRWSDAEIEQVRTVLQRQANGELDRQLRLQGVYLRHHHLPAGQLAAQAWVEAARGINHVIDVFALGNPPRYPAIDSPAFDVKSDRYARLVAVAVSVLQDEMAEYRLFFEAPLRFALALLDANWRDEAGRHEPLHLGENAKAYQAIASTRFERFPYSVIVVPGSGADRPGVAMSPWGRFRSQLAARRWREGKAPFLILSGGYVHPAHTPYCEALEMKRVLMRDYGIPESAILIDPHARHTTTNLRNAARLIFRYGIPFDRMALVTTDLDQSRYIESELFALRCDKELGYRPYKLGRRLSPSDIEFWPRAESLHVDPLDPLDP